MNRTLNHAISLINPNFKHVLEFGVAGGGTISQIRETLSDEFLIYGFDSFFGLPEDWIGTRLKKGEFSTNGEVPKINGVEFFKGWFVETIPEYKKIAEPIALIHIDCDLYSSTIDILYGLRDYIVEGTILVFDEWYYNAFDIEQNRQHEQKAFYEWVKEFDIKYELLNNIEIERKIVKIL